MNLPRSTLCADLGCEQEDAVVGEVTAITETRRGYGYRRVTAELRNRGMVVNSKKVRRIMRENGLNPKRKRRYVQTTDSDHDSAIYPNVAKDCEVYGPDQPWVGDITYIAIATGFAHLAVILDASSRKVVGYALGRNVDVRLTTGALDAAIEARRPFAGLRVPFRSRLAKCRSPAPSPAQASRLFRIHEPSRQSVRRGPWP